MSEKTNGQFNYRAFVSVLAGFTFLVMAVTGLVMFFAPSCRIARDTSWTVWGHSKDQWTGVHVWFSLAFVIASAFHIYLNWACLTSYFKNKLRQGLALRTEWIVALVICGVIGLGTLYGVAPFSSLTAWKETFKHSEVGAGAGGQGWRGGRASVQQGQSYFGSPAGSTGGPSSDPGCQESQTGSCETAGKSCSAESACDTSRQPQNLMQPSRQGGSCEEGAAQAPVAAGGSFGIGQKTLGQFCADEGIELSWAISRLQSKGLTVRQTMTMREIADGAGVHPRELRSLLQTR